MNMRVVHASHGEPRNVTGFSRCRKLSFVSLAFATVVGAIASCGSETPVEAQNNQALDPAAIKAIEPSQPADGVPEDSWIPEDLAAGIVMPELDAGSPDGRDRFRPSAWLDYGGQAYHGVRDLLGERLHVGIRSMQFSFDQDMSRVGEAWDDYFIGSINELRDIQETSWKHYTYGIYPVRNLGIEYHRDEVRARTFTDSDDNHSDGDFVVKGDVFAAVARLPLDQVLHGIRHVFHWPPRDDGWEYDVLGRFVPYVGLGIDAFTRMRGTFEADPWWANGYSSPAAWERMGRPDTRYQGHFRELRVVEDDIGRYRLYGLSVRLIDSLYVDINWSNVKADLDVDFYLAGRYRSSGKIPMSYSSKNIGIRYFF